MTRPSFSAFAAAAFVSCLALPFAPAASAQASFSGGAAGVEARELAVGAGRGVDGAPSASEVRVRECLTAAAEAHRLPPAVLVILLKVEGGTLGRVTRNTNDTADIGPMQVNTIWVPKIAQHWRTTREAAYQALRDNLCANLEGGAWILRQAMDEARGDFWGGVAIYHSHNPEHQRRYLRGVLEASLRLQAQARGAAAPPAPATAAQTGTARPAAPSAVAGAGVASRG